MEAGGHEGISAVMLARCGDSAHSSCDHSYHSPLAGRSECESMKDVSPTCCTMFSRGVLHRKATFCLGGESERQLNSA